MKIYLVVGSTGEYSDSINWYVAWYKNEKKAQKHCELATQEAKIIKFKYEDKYGYEMPLGINKYDKYMQMDYTGTIYNVEKVEEGRV